MAFKDCDLRDVAGVQKKAPMSDATEQDTLYAKILEVSGPPALGKTCVFSPTSKFLSATTGPALIVFHRSLLEKTFKVNFCHCLRLAPFTTSQNGFPTSFQNSLYWEESKTLPEDLWGSFEAVAQPTVLHRSNVFFRWTTPVRGQGR